MKKVIFALVAMVGVSMSAQTSKYVSVSTSFGNINGAGETVATNSYPSIEVGVIKHDIAFGLAFGASKFVQGKPWLEAKVTPSFPLGYVSGNIIFGLGSYLTNPEGKNDKIFTEVGFGISKTFSNNVGVGVSVSRWDGFDYVSPSVSYTF